MTIPEIKRLAARLLEEGQTGDFAQRAGLRLTAKALLAMTHLFNRYDVLRLDCP